MAWEGAIAMTATTTLIKCRRRFRTTNRTWKAAFSCRPLSSFHIVSLLVEHKQDCRCEFVHRYSVVNSLRATRTFPDRNLLPLRTMLIRCYTPWIGNFFLNCRTTLVHIQMCTTKGSTCGLYSCNLQAIKNRILSRNSSIFTAFFFAGKSILLVTLRKLLRFVDDHYYPCALGRL